MVSDPQRCTSSVWEEVFLLERPRLLRLISRRIGGTECAEDVLQEVALAAQASANQPSDASELVRWLQAVTMNKIRDHWRKQHRRTAITGAAAVSEPGDDSWTPLHGMLASEQRQSLDRAIAALPEVSRRLLEAKYIDGQTYAEMARQLGCTEKSLEYRLLKAREQLRVLVLANDE